MDSSPQSENTGQSPLLYGEDIIINIIIIFGCYSEPDALRNFFFFTITLKWGDQLAQVFWDFHKTSYIVRTHPLTPLSPSSSGEAGHPTGGRYAILISQVRTPKFKEASSQS